MAKTTIHSDYIPDNAITSTKIAENSIGAREIATNAITTLYVADDSVTADKLANSINTDIALGVAALPKTGGTLSGNLRIDNSASTAVRLQLNNTGSNDYASIYADTASAYKNLILNPLGGEVLIGKTAADNTTVGIRLLGSAGFGCFVRDGNTPVVLNRLTSDGEILRFDKDGSTVGSIGGGATFLTIGSGTGNVYFQNGVMAPTASSGGASSNGVIDLGTSSSKFKDLYLSGTVTASYIAASNSVFAGSGGAGAMALKVTYSGADKFTVQNTGNVAVAGALSKGSGSFKIDHPLESKKDTHHLVHSFVEAPQADLIYRGVVVLENGTATINLDTVSGMSEGTYVTLNTNTSCFTSNETDWDAVKGSVSGNILTINCQNDSSTATVSWLVIGERQDQHMKDTDWTDDNGKVIVEPTK